MKGHCIKRAALAAAATFVAGTLASTQAEATEGYFQPGYSGVQKSLAGTGAADAEDAMTLAINPAGLAFVGEEFEADASLFAPTRGYTAEGPGFVAPGFSSGSESSGWGNFLIPGFAYSQPIDANSSWGIALYGNGGMNTSYDNVPNSACGPFSGVFCGGEAGVNLNQMFISPGYAWRTGNMAFGIAPIFALQMFDAQGLAAFSPFSTDPNNLTNRGISYSYGGGVRLGLLWNLLPNLRLGLAGATPMWMSNFDKYKGLFADHGSFDIPASMTAGVAWDALPDWTFMLDYKRIFYSSVDAVGDSSNVPLPFGSTNGPGFGWSDVNVVSVGAEWRATPDLTLRAGYAHNNDPISSADVTINILAPGVVTDHISGGGTYKLGEHSNFDVSVMYVPSNSVSGIEVTPLGPNPGRTITLSMHQWDFTLGYRYEF